MSEVIGLPLICVLCPLHCPQAAFKSGACHDENEACPDFCGTMVQEDKLSWPAA